jgi:hypothetical protein
MRILYCAVSRVRAKLVAALEVRAGDMIISFLYNPFTNQPGQRLLKITQSAQFADAFNKRSLPKADKATVNE